ncbi:unnamed protein product [Miscanthus lutarioriparius]|uniref:Glycosyl hydrolase family 38 C-terminal domain-containing protein n=1 Tax=Miscanthus lutarioriparius TaxID=422564 RepID=A0A811QCB1_9POAL|nr:unnamed protein product [Miscanthus lutarioriparius]
MASGAYIFCPNGTVPIKTDGQVLLTVLRGPILDEVHQQINSWIYQITRVYKGKDYVENEFIVNVEDDSKELSVLVDRSIGGSSIKDEQIELMLHRNIMRNISLKFEQIEGKYYIKIDPQGEGARWRRTFGQEIYSPLLVFTEQAGGNWANSHVAKFSAMDSTYSLPDNVAMLTFQELENGSVLRFAHLYEVLHCILTFGCYRSGRGQGAQGSFSFSES